MWGQAECDELAQRAEALKEENSSLRGEVSRLRSEYEQLLAQNASLKVLPIAQVFDCFLQFVLYNILLLSSKHLMISL